MGEMLLIIPFIHKKSLWSFLNWIETKQYFISIFLTLLFSSLIEQTAFPGCSNNTDLGGSLGLWAYSKEYFIASLLCLQDSEIWRANKLPAPLYLRVLRKFHQPQEIQSIIHLYVLELTSRTTFMSHDSSEILSPLCKMIFTHVDLDYSWFTLRYVKTLKPHKM